MYEGMCSKIKLCIDLEFYIDLLLCPIFSINAKVILFPATPFVKCFVNLIVCDGQVRCYVRGQLENVCIKTEKIVV